MSLREKIQWFLEELTGVRVYRRAPRGIDLFEDIRAHLPNLRLNVIFDVGANTGQSARRYLKRFPHARLYSFEPVQSTFDKLQHGLRGRRNVSTVRLALGAARGTGQMVLEGDSNLSYHLLGSHDAAPADAQLEAVTIETLDDFCQAHDISHIDCLKIDTEGGDFDVLTGGVRMLSDQRIDLIELEAGMNPGNTRHVAFEKLKSFLEERRYFLFGLYEQTEEWPTKEPHLRRTNPVFISDKTVRANTRRRRRVGLPWEPGGTTGGRSGSDR